MVALIYLVSVWAIRIAVLQVLHNANSLVAIALVGPEHIVDISVRTLFLGAHGGRMTLVLCGAIIALIAFFVRRNRETETRLLLALALVSLTVFAVIGTQVSIFLSKTIFWISAPILLLLAGAVASLQRRSVRVAACCSLGACLTVDLLKVMPALEQEDWVAPVAIVSQVPGAVLLVKSEAMAVLAEGSCRRIAGGSCPYTVLAVIDPKDRYDSWARGSFTGPHVAVDQVAATVGSRPAFLFRKAHHHSLPELLHRNGVGRGIPSDAPPLIGPFNAEAFR